MGGRRARPPGGRVGAAAAARKLAGAMASRGSGAASAAAIHQTGPVRSGAATVRKQSAALPHTHTHSVRLHLSLR